MSRTFELPSLPLLALLGLAPLLSPVLACDGESLGAPCTVDEDCAEAMSCDIHEGQGTCQEDHGHGSEHDSTHESAGEHEGGDSELDCAAETRGDSFEIGLSKAGETLTASFVAAEPAPPAKGENTWILAWTDASGEPVEGLSFEVMPMMPDHGHGTPIVPEVAATQTPGEYRIEPLDLFMAGYWEIQIDVSDGEVSDALSFGFCVE